MARAKTERRLVANTAYLYALTLSSQAISLLTIPYQTRVLSPETYGIVGFAMSAMTVASLFVNYGFLYSATQAVAEHGDDREYLSKIYTSVLLAKCLIGALVGVVVVASTALVPLMRENAAIMITYYVAYVFSVLLPDYLYRGMEQMKVITIRTVAIRVFSSLLIFVFLKSEKDVLVLPLSMLLGNLIALIVCFRYDRKTFGVGLSAIGSGFLVQTLREGLPFFISRAASTVYQSANAAILGALYPGEAVVGWYNAADKLQAVFRYASSPIADSMYPYMLRNRKYKVAIGLLLLSVPLILVTATLLFLFADDACAILFGEEYREAGDVVRCLIPAMAVIFPTYLICFPILVPMGLSRQANTSNVIGMVVQIALLVTLAATHRLDVYALCLSASASEVTVFCYRLAVMLLHLDRMKSSTSVDVPGGHWR
ncbi:TPA: oligosaccharide flippase family protein [Clostridioides difficile]|nr:oligosaccharide flippase family protein [Clostridioides difficile]